MKFLIVFAAVVAVTLAAVPNQRQFPVPSIRQFPVSNEKQVVVVKETPSNNIGLENYLYSYELSDGQKRQESAEVVARSAEDVVLRVTGSFSFVGQDGQTYTVKYVADENGFQPEGAHLPVAPVV